MEQRDAPCIKVADLITQWTERLLRQHMPTNFFMTESPVYPLVTNAAGQRSGFLANGEKVEEIPGSLATIIDDKHLIFFPGQHSVDVQIASYEDGTMNVHATFIQEDNTAIAFSHNNVDVKQGMEATLDSTNRNHALDIDYDADGVVDESVEPDVIEEIIPEASSEPDERDSVAVAPESSQAAVSLPLLVSVIGGLLFIGMIFLLGIQLGSRRRAAAGAAITAGQTRSAQPRARRGNFPLIWVVLAIVISLVLIVGALWMSNTLPVPFRDFFMGASGDMSDTPVSPAMPATPTLIITPTETLVSQPTHASPPLDMTPTSMVFPSPIPSPTPTLTLEPAMGMMAFTSNRDGSFQIYTVRSDGSNLTQLTSTAANNWDPAWLPDGQRIAFVSDRDGDKAIYVMNRDGSEQTRLITSPAIDESDWSPDGTSIVFHSNHEGNYDLYTLDIQTGTQTRLTSTAANEWDPSWSPDGTRIAFRTDRDGNDNIYVMNADGSEQQRLTDHPTEDETPDWSADGQHIVFQSHRDGGHEIYTMHADGSEPIRMTYDPADDWDAVWSSDNRQIAFQSNRDGNDEIYVIDQDGSNLTRVTNHNAQDWDPAWAP
jgi:hypothetical protein